MYRLNRGIFGRQARASRAIAVIVACVLLGGVVVGCGGTRQQVRNPAHVETLRLKITKARNAIEETRNTIALSRGAPYLPELFLRLAELLSEEARYHYQLAYEREQRSTRELHVPQVRVLKEEAISLYEMILKRFPDSPLVPRVLYNIGHEQRELGDFDAMRKTLRTLVTKHPDSALRYDALLVLGDFHFDRTELDDAKVYYQEITKGKLNKLTGLGHYKLAWVWVNEGACGKALVDFERAIVRSEEWENPNEEVAAARAEALQLSGQAGTQQDIDVRREALVDMAYCYSRERPTKGAVVYFRDKAYNRPTYLAALDKLANRYRVMDKADGATEATRQLLWLGPSNEDRIDDARTFYAGLKKQKAYDSIGTDTRLIADALVRYYSRPSLDDEARSRLKEEFELYIRDLLTTAQSRLPKLKGLKQAALANELITSYRIYVDTFPEGEAFSEMLLNMSEVLAVAGRDLDAGLRAVQAAGYLEDNKEKSEALYDAVVYFQASLDREAGRQQYERVTARATLRRAASELLRIEGLDADKARRVKFAIAQTYYDGGDYNEAIDKLTAVAYEYPGTNEADSAIALVLDSYYTINDSEGLMFAGRRFMADGSPASEQKRADIKPIVAAAEEKQLDEISLTTAGEEGGGTGLAALENFAKDNLGTALGERALLNAFVAARAVGDTEKLNQLAEDIAKNYPKSEQLPGIYTSLAQGAVARFEYDQAVRYLRQAADVNPQQRVRLLVAAAEILDALGDAQGSSDLYKNALRDAEGPTRIEVLDKYSTLVERQNAPAAVVSALEPFSNEGSAGTLARLGLAQIAAGKPDAGEGSLQSATNVASTSPEAEARVHYGNTEVLLATVRKYPTPTDLDLLQELIDLIEVLEEGYLNAAQQGGPQFATMALGRLSFAAKVSAELLEKTPLPTNMSAEDKAQIAEAIKNRVATLRATSKQALDACAQQAWSNRLYNPVIRKCMAGQPFDGKGVPFDNIKPRGTPGRPDGTEELRNALSQNPEDKDNLRELGLKYLDAGDAHVARLILARAVAAGGGATEQNLLGIACYKVGDLAGAFSAFVQAAEGSLEAGRANLAKVLTDAGLGEMAAEVDKRYPAGNPGGRLIGGGTK